MSQYSQTSDLTSDDKLWSLLAYIINPIFPILILVMEDKKNRPFMKYHAIQALCLCVIIVVLSFVCVGVLVWFYSIYCGIKAYQGEYVTIPLITDFCKKQGWIK